MQELVEITEKKQTNIKCHNVILTICILSTAFGIIMPCIKQECNSEISLINRSIFFVCINLRTLTEGEVSIFHIYICFAVT